MIRASTNRHLWLALAAATLTGCPEASVSPPAGTQADQGVSETTDGSLDATVHVDAGDPQDASGAADAGTEDGDAGGACPTAVINVAPSTDARPLQRINLSGTDSFSPNGDIVQYAWRVATRPPGSTSPLVPGDSSPALTFLIDLVGTYVFELSVRDSRGIASCEPATATVTASPTRRLVVELVWDTPADLDPTDMGPGAGADHDLHFAHPNAAAEDIDGDGTPEPWFDTAWDCFWFNARPNWGSLDPAVDDDPRLDRDDSDGAGPEIISLHTPEDRTYRIGVHYWNDHGFGESTATVRIYVDGQLARALEATLASRDMWAVAELSWPSGTVTPLTGGDGLPHIIPNYDPSNF